MSISCLAARGEGEHREHTLRGMPSTKCAGLIHASGLYSIELYAASGLVRFPVVSRMECIWAVDVQRALEAAPSAPNRDAKP